MKSFYEISFHVFLLISLSFVEYKLPWCRPWRCPYHITVGTVCSYDVQCLSTTTSSILHAGPKVYIWFGLPHRLCLDFWIKTWSFNRLPHMSWGFLELLQTFHWPPIYNFFLAWPVTLNGQLLLATSTAGCNQISFMVEEKGPKCTLHFFSWIFFSLKNLKMFPFSFTSHISIWF